MTPIRVQPGQAMSHLVLVAAGVVLLSVLAARIHAVGGLTGFCLMAVVLAKSMSGAQC
jgi:hypothetical protein